MDNPLEAVRCAKKEEALYEALGPVDRMIFLRDRECRMNDA
jgi:hypothetical protein